MQVKIFEAPDMASGLRKVRKELGPDALILSTRTVKNGKMGILGKKHLEITAAVDHQWEEKKTELPQDISAASAAMKYSSNLPDNEQTLSHSEAYIPTPETSKENNQSPTKENLTFTFEPKVVEEKRVEEKGKDLPEEFYQLKDMVKNLAGEISRMSAPEQEQNITLNKPILSKLEEKLLSGKINNDIEEILLSNGVNSDTARIISTFANERLADDKKYEAQELIEFLHFTISDILNVEPIDFTVSGSQKRIALIGPTGVGKTTTLAKIAAKYLAEKSHSVAFITVDTYRIAAVEQLKVYGEIMHLPVEVVITPQQLHDALQKHSDKELILIDTAGRSPLDNLSIDEISSYFLPELEIENHLVLAASTRDKELLETIDRFSKLSIKSTIVTKIDECIDLGVLLNVQAQTSSPISFITDGQRVPEDIRVAETDYLAQLIIPSATGNVYE